MTDNEIIKALECCITNKCDECAIYKECHNENSKGRVQVVLDLINRQQTQIEKLNVDLVGMRGACESYKIHYDNAQAEIAELQRKNTELEIELQAMRNAANLYKAEVERLESELNKEKLIKEMYRLTVEEVKAEAIKGFAEIPTADVVEVVRCEKCTHRVDYCGRIMCAGAELPQPEQYIEKASEAVTMPLSNDLCVKHDYRQIKIAPNTTVTIDLEQEKKKLQEELTKHLRCGFLQNGS